MALCSTIEMLRKAQAEGYAVGAFNVENMEMIQAVVAAAQEMRSPVILQTTPSTVAYASPEYFYSMAKVAAEGVDVPVAIHLDHGNSFQLAMQAFRSGYTSIMIDGSHETFEDNINLSRRVVESCSPAGVAVEAELGMVGGKEDDLDGGAGGYTDPEKAKIFVEQTGVNSLAVAIGTAHGVYASAPKLDLDRLTQIREKVSIPLVLHGASGLSDEDVAESIRRGICKVNFATELRIAYSNGVKGVIGENEDVFDPKKYNSRGRVGVKELVMNRIKVCNSAGKA